MVWSLINYPSAFHLPGQTTLLSLSPPQGITYHPSSLWELQNHHSVPVIRQFICSCYCPNLSFLSAAHTKEFRNLPPGDGGRQRGCVCVMFRGWSLCSPPCTDTLARGPARSWAACCTHVQPLNAFNWSLWLHVCLPPGSTRGFNWLPCHTH